MFFAIAASVNIAFMITTTMFIIVAIIYTMILSVIRVDIVANICRTVLATMVLVISIVLL